MLTLTHDEKLKLMRSLNWDYLDKPEDMLAVIEGQLESSGAFTRDKLFVRSLERLNWYRIVGLWGIETIKELYSPELAKRIWPKEMKGLYDSTIAILRRETVSSARWGDEHYQQMWRPFLSNRWYSA